MKKGLSSRKLGDNQINGDQDKNTVKRAKTQWQQKDAPAKVRIFSFALALASCLCGKTAALALSPDLKQGIPAYNTGDYKEAVSHLSGALSQDFNNAVLHYYLANSFVHLGQRDAAIREFRIAYALEPEKEAGKLSKLALKYMGVETGAGEAEQKPLPPPLPPPKSQTELRKEKTAASLKEQVDRERQLNERIAAELADSTARRGADLVSRQKNELLDAMKYIRRGRVHQLPLPADSLKQLEAIKSFYDGQSSMHKLSAGKRTSELQKSAENLQDLMSEKNCKKGPKLIPEGSNLYVRSYHNSTDASKESKSHK